MRLYSSVNYWGISDSFMRTYSGRSIGIWRPKNCVKVDKVRIAKRQETVNNELDQVKRTCGRVYISKIIFAASIYGDACTIGILLLRSDLTHNHGVVNFLPSVARDIFKDNDAESVCALNALFLGELLSFSKSLACLAKFIGV